MSEFYPTSHEDIEQHINYGSALKRRYSYDEIHELVRKGAFLLKNDDFFPDYIISIAGGGLIPARMLRAYIDVPILNMTVTSYEGNSHTPTSEPIILQSIDPELIRGKKILIVDEVDDTRATLKKVVSELETHVEECGIFVVHNKEKAKQYLIDSDTVYIACEDTPGNMWIEYPWDLI